ncbi:hypothetical protein PCHDS_000503300, partial [Plasmodium chabaudi adami]
TQGDANTIQQGTSGGSGGGKDSKVGDSDSGAGGASGDTGSSSTGSGNLDKGSHDQDPGSDTGDKKGLPIDHNPRTLPPTSGTDKKGSNDGEGNTNNEPSNGGGEQGGQDDQKTPDGSGDSETGPGSEQNPTDSTPREKETQNASWPPFDIKPYMLIIKLKGMEQINNALKFFNENTEKIKEAIDTINSLYNTSVSNLKNTFNNFTEFFNNFIINLSIDSKQLEKTPVSGDKQSGSGVTGDNPPTPNAPSELPKDSGDNKPGSDGKEGNPPTDNGPSQSQKDSDKQDSHQTTSDISETPKAPQTSQITQNSKEQIQEQQPSQDPSENQNSDRTDQKGLQKPAPVPVPVTKKENIGTELKGNGIAEIGDSCVLKWYKQFVISTIVLLIPIALTILYKYLSFGRRNELKKKNNMKKVINMVGVNKTTKTVINSSDGKKQIQIIIKSSGQKKQTKKSINYVYGEKSPSLNIYQLMQADPVPFINLIFLLIFFVYKRKRDFIE